jgi:hypothetical protein
VPPAKPVVVKVLLGKPPKQDFVRVRTEPDFQRQIYTLKDSRKGQTTSRIFIQNGYGPNTDRALESESRSCEKGRGSLRSRE